jgi:hypothetical protein
VIEVARRLIHDCDIVCQHSESVMLSHLVQQLSRLLPQGAPAAKAPPPELPERGWHESSWSLAQGADVIELPPSVAASLFPDTVPAFHGPSES